MSGLHEALGRLTEGDVPVVMHPLGFACLRIRDGLCVHAWLPGEPELEPCLTTGPIHCHGGDFDSEILTGRLSNAIHQVIPSLREEATARLYRIYTSPQGDEITATQRYVRHALGHVDHYGPGDVYHLPAGTFHATYTTGVTVTLLAATDRGGLDVSVGPLRASTTPRITRRRTASAALTEQVTDLAVRSLKEHA